MLAHNRALDVAEEAAKTSWEAVVAKEDVGGLKKKSVSSSSSFDNDISIDVAGYCVLMVLDVAAIVELL